MKKRLLKEKMRRAKQHAKHNLGAPKLKEGEVAWADPAVCESTNGDAVDTYNIGCKDGQDDDGSYPNSEMDKRPDFCYSDYDIPGVFEAFTMCCGCGGGNCQEGYRKVVYASYTTGFLAAPQIVGLPLCCLEADIDVCDICNGGVTDVALCPDACGVVGGDGSSCAGCDGVSNSGLVNDDCGVCDGSNACHDDCGVPNGDGSSCAGCDGVSNSGLVNDDCGVCDGSNACHDDCGVPNGNNACHDACGVPNGDDSTCSFTIVGTTNAGCQTAKDYYNDQCSC